MPIGSKDRPNVIVFFTDQQRWDSTGVHGNPLNLTPNFDRMARRGTHVFNAFTCQPVCGPARSCLQTGLYATKSGCFKNGIPLPEDARTLAHHFADGGYQTGYIGKWHLAKTGAQPVPRPRRGGYDYWLAADVLEFTSDAYDLMMFDGENQRVKLPGYRVDAQTDAAIRYIDQHQQAPFFLFLSFLEPHHQNHRDDYPAPQGYEECYRGRWVPPDLAALPGVGTEPSGGSAHQHLAGYWGMVKRLDEALGRLQDALRSLDLAEKTIIVFTSDHGCHFKTRNAEYKRSGHESSIRVPMAFCGPGLDGGGQLQQLVSLIDLPPTLLNAAHLPVPQTMQGRSILPLLRRQRKDWPREIFVQISESQIGRAVRTHRWKYGVTAPDKNGNEQPGSELYREEYLYDLQSDAYELTNLIGRQSHQAVANKMKERLIRRMIEAGEPEPIIESAPAVPGGQRKVRPEEVDA